MICMQIRKTMKSQCTKKSVYFISISGSGWLLDFIIYGVLVNIFEIPVKYANIMSAVPAFTFVFYFSTKKIFEENINNISLEVKYIIYFLYQCAFIIFISYILECAYYVVVLSFNNDISVVKIFVKILIAPLSVLCNFVVMKFLVEKI